MYYYIIFTNQIEVSTTHLQQFRMADTLIPRMEIVAASFNHHALCTATATAQVRVSLDTVNASFKIQKSNIQQSHDLCT